MKFRTHLLTTLGVLMLTATLVSSSVATPQTPTPAQGDIPRDTPRPAPLQAALDTDKDGELSATEIANASASLKTLDKNKDGKLSADEFRPVPVQIGPTAAEMVARLLEFDENKDGKLTKDELPDQLATVFATIDTDHDGTLTSTELTAFVEQQDAAARAKEEEQRQSQQRPGAGPSGPGQGGQGGPGGRRGGLQRISPIQAALDTDKDGEISAAEIANAPTSLKTLDKNNDGKISLEELRPAQGGFGGSTQERVDRLMESDRNGDGKLSLDELPERMKDVMPEADTDHDGFLTPAELTAYFEKQGAGRREEARP